MKYTEEQVREAYKTGFEFARQYFGSGTSDELDEDDFISSLNPKEVEEDKISFTYSFLRRKIDWKQFCDLTGIDYYATKNGFEIKDNEVFYITESQAKKYNLL